MYKEACRFLRDTGYFLFPADRGALYHSSTLYTTGYWQIGGNQKRSFEHYRACARRTLKFFRGASLVVYTDSDWFAELAQQSMPGDQIVVVFMQVESLPSRRLAQLILNSWERQQSKSLIRQYYSDPTMQLLQSKEKGLVHHSRDLLGSGSDVSLDLLSIWLSKLQLCLKSSATRSSHPPAWLAWADASLSRFNFRRDSWDIRRVPPTTGRIRHYPSPMRYLGKQLHLNASFLLGSPTIFRTVAQSLDNAVIAAAEDCYCHDEETLLQAVLLQHPEWFYLIG